MDNRLKAKSAALLSFLHGFGEITRKRPTTYGRDDQVLWFKDIRWNSEECTSPFLSGGEEKDEFSDVWLEMRKPRRQACPYLPPQIAVPWLPDNIRLDNPSVEPKLRTSRTVFKDGEVETLYLEDYPEVQDAWELYIKDKWRPWAEERRKVQEAYDKLYQMYRKRDERFELVLSVGHLTWIAPKDSGVRGRSSRGMQHRVIRRHVLVAPAEIEFDGDRGTITVSPAADFPGVKVDLDMLAPQHRPKLPKERIESCVEEIDVQLWDVEKVLPLLREIANRMDSRSVVREGFDLVDKATEHPVIDFAPAIILRARRMAAYSEMMEVLAETAQKCSLALTAPWTALIAEGNELDGNELRNSRHTVKVEGDPLFPLPTNNEQIQIVKRLGSSPCVLVKGPPGTGKSHTIANLICHLLAEGDRILVTAHTAKALEVLRGKLPEELQALCISALGSSRNEQKLLESSVRGILARQTTWEGPEESEQAIAQAEQTLRTLKEQFAATERQLREVRESEMHSHSLPGGYKGTKAQIAKQLNKERGKFGWIEKCKPKYDLDEPDFPLSPAELQRLVQLYTKLDAGKQEELSRGLYPSLDVPDPDVFAEMVSTYKGAKREVESSGISVDDALIQSFGRVGDEELIAAVEALKGLSDRTPRAEHLLGGDTVESIISAALVGAEAKWTGLCVETIESLSGEVDALLDSLKGTDVCIQCGDVPRAKLESDARQRLDHFKQGKGTGFWVFVPKVVRETNYILESCLVDGASPETPDGLEKLLGYLALERRVNSAKQRWADVAAFPSDPKLAVQEMKSAVEEILGLVGLVQGAKLREVLAPLGRHVAELASYEQRGQWTQRLSALLSARKLHYANQEIANLQESVLSAAESSRAHPVMSALRDAAKSMDVESWKAAWTHREALLAGREEMEEYRALLGKLKPVLPWLVDELVEHPSDPEWSERIEALDKAWYWGLAAHFIAKVSDPKYYDALLVKSKRLQERIEDATKRLAALKAWHAFFTRLDRETSQYLVAWQKAVRRIGKGTGKYAYKHRRDAQRYLRKCVDRIPAWIMPLYKLWESARAEPGLFDTIIIDEASQAGTDALVLFLLAKRIIVVGDDQQNSPEGVGIKEDDISRLIKDHLRLFEMRSEFRPNVSLFDHAERTFGTPISLREHFRCVPEIIRFSNELCYSDYPLIPLRQPPPNRLEPLKSVFVGGVCEGSGSSVQNKTEAEAIVDTIERILNDKRYEGKDIGVIALQGKAQAQLIESMLVKRIGPEIMEKRRIRCGEPANFQGDERDVVLLSMVMSADRRFRALSRLPDRQRYNVAMSRAKDQVWLFHSVKLNDLSPEDLRYALIEFFEKPAEVDFAFEEHERLEREAAKPRELGTQPPPYDSWFEVDVALRLLRLGYRVRPQVKAGAYRIDLVVEGLNNRIAVECDGDHWHGAENYEKDMARQRQLERAGWTFVRVRESEFYVNPKAAIERVVRVCEEHNIRPEAKRKATHQGKGTLI